MFKKYWQKFSKNQDPQRFSADEIKLHNDNAKLRNKVSKEREGEKRRSNTLRELLVLNQLKQK